MPTLACLTSYHAHTQSPTIQCWAGWGVQVHPLSSPLVLGPDNVGLVLTAYTADMAAGMPRPIVSGGVRVGPFAPDPARHGVLKADAPTSATRPSVMFAEGGGWLHRARLPRRGNGPLSAYVTLHATNGPLTANCCHASQLLRVLCDQLLATAGQVLGNCIHQLLFKPRMTIALMLHVHNRAHIHFHIHTRSIHRLCSYNRYYDDESTYHWARPLEPGSKAGYPDVDKLGFVYNSSSSPGLVRAQ